MRNSVFGNTLWRLLGVMFSGALAITPTYAAIQSANGFVTQVTSPSNFYLGSLHIALDAKTQCATEELDSNIEIQNKPFAAVLSHRLFGLDNRLNPDTRTSIACSAAHIALGTHIDVMGEYADSTRSLSAVHLTVYQVTVQQLIGVYYMTITENRGDGALIEEKPTVHFTGKGWTGTIWHDGYPVTLTPNTSLLTAQAGSGLSLRSFGPAFLQHLPQPGIVTPQATTPVFTDSLFQPNTWATYWGLDPYDKRWVGEDGVPFSKSIELQRLRLWPNQISAREKKYQARMNPMIQPPNFTSHLPGKIRFRHKSAQDTLEILADQKIQRFVSNLGESVIPSYQKELPRQAETKVHFHFYVTHGERPGVLDEMDSIHGLYGLASKSPSGNLVAFPSGVIVIPDSFLARMNNEAQLASLLSCAVTVVLQKQSYISHYAEPYSWKPSYGEYPDQLLPPLFGDEQSLRIGIRQMYLAGYDIREAPYAWAVAQGKPANNPVINSQHPDKEIPWYAAYAFDYISQYYKDVDYTKLKRGEAEYQQFLQQLRKADPEAFAPTHP